MRPKALPQGDYIMIKCSIRQIAIKILNSYTLITQPQNTWSKNWQNFKRNRKCIITVEDLNASLGNWLMKQGKHFLWL